MTKVKVCGITNMNDALAAVAAGADYLGFVFCASPRQISPAVAQPIVVATAGRSSHIAVFKDVPVAEILAVIAECPVDCIQLHGAYSVADLRKLKEQTGRRIVRAVTPQSPDYAAELEQLADDSIDMVLIDPRGSVFDWRSASDVQRYGKPLFIAGCLSPANVELAVAMTRPYGVDVATGVEKRAGPQRPCAAGRLC